MRLAFESVDSVKYISFPSMVGDCQSIDDSEWNHGEGRNLPLLFSASPLSWDIYTYLLQSLDLNPLGFKPIGSSGSQAFCLKLNYLTGFCDSLACKQYILWLLSFHNHEPIPHNLCLYLPTYLFLSLSLSLQIFPILLVPSLWRTLSNVMPLPLPIP